MFKERLSDSNSDVQLTLSNNDTNHVDLSVDKRGKKFSLHVWGTYSFLEY